jgi:hypothetical protein
MPIFPLIEDIHILVQEANRIEDGDFKCYYDELSNDVKFDESEEDDLITMTQPSASDIIGSYIMALSYL